jgi:hypothetical protein
MLLFQWFLIALSVRPGKTLSNTHTLAGKVAIKAALIDIKSRKFSKALQKKKHKMAAREKIKSRYWTLESETRKELPQCKKKLRAFLG